MAWFRGAPQPCSTSLSPGYYTVRKGGLPGTYGMTSILTRPRIILLVVISVLTPGCREQVPLAPQSRDITGRMVEAIKRFRERNTTIGDDI